MGKYQDLCGVDAAQLLGLPTVSFTAAMSVVCQRSTDWMVGFNGFLCANMPSFLWNRMSLSETPGQKQIRMKSFN